ncbi:MAG: molybdopterin molybdotransferase MoeA [Rhodobacteraceae bacterium]|nr:molybdopterin molybdotransferase MoeA [Paracoccaceae bacterium]
MITVSEALERLFALLPPPQSQNVPLIEAPGRVMLTDAVARRDQPPFAASAMDGYAMRRDDVRSGNQLDVIGEAAAGHRYGGTIQPGQTVRIFTGAPVPQGGEAVVIQENVTATGGQITLGPDAPGSQNIRPAAGDFAIGSVLHAPRRIRAADCALLAAMNVATISAARRPSVAIIATGDELVMPGEDPNENQIIASNSFGLHAMIKAAGGAPRLLPIARDTTEALALALELAKDADIIVTIGGASVGDHDLVAAATQAAGMERSFWKVAMRPGKPLMAGKIGKSVLIGLPGNPVSALVCGRVFLIPVIEAMLGLPAKAPAQRSLPLAAALAANGPRAHFLRAQITDDGVRAFGKQDSSLLTVLADADCLIVQPPGDSARAKGEMINIIDL